MDEATPLTPFDTMTQTREIQMLKTVIPYMKSSQKKQFAILIKYMELQNTLHDVRLFKGGTGLIHVLPAGRGKQPTVTFKQPPPFLYPKRA